jgi:uncharacterized repeat protein (TIGR01451 family)
VAELNLTATAADAGAEAGTPGAVVADAGDNDTDLVLGQNGGTQTITTVLRVNNNAALELDKRVSEISDPQGGDQPVPGAHITYEITIRVLGEGVLDDVVISDLIPSNTDYRLGSLTLDGLSQTDSADTDAAEFDGGNNQILVDLGSVTAPSADRVVTFQATIQ